MTPTVTETGPPTVRRPGRARIWMLIGSFWPAREGGAERQCRRLIRQLVRRGQRVTVLTLRHVGGEKTVSRCEGAAVVRLGWAGPWSERGTRALARLLLPLALAGARGERLRAHLVFWLSLPMVYVARLVFIRELRSFAAGRNMRGVLHVHESGWLAGVGVELARESGLRVLCKTASFPALDPIAYDTPRRRKWDRCRRQADAWIALTSAGKSDLLREGLAPDIVHLVPNGVELPLEPGAASHSAEVLYVGNFSQGSAWKAFDVLFDAWIQVVRRHPEARLTVVGGGDAAPWMRRLQAAGMLHAVRFAGAVGDVSPFYRAAGIFVLPSRVEGLSNALLEAQSWGLACVVSDIPGNQAVVESEANGLVVPVGDAPALANALLRMLEEPDLRGRLGKAGRAKVEASFDIAKVADQVQGIYRRLLDGGGA